MSDIDSFGWIASGGLMLLLIGIVIGARLFRPPTINVAPHAEAHSSSAGSGGSDSGRGGGLPLGMLIIGVVAVTALVAVSNAGSSVSDMAQHSIDAQAETFKAIPTPIIIQQPDPVVVRQPDPVVVQQPVAEPSPTTNVTDVLSAIASVAVVLLVVFSVVAVLITRKPRQEPPPLTRSGQVTQWNDAFEIARENVKRGGGR